MAFNFNWSPLTGNSTTSSAFYEHAKSLLTAALNKSTKPPIIVDDILVDDLNLGESAPDLEILEIGDIAEDRFRGIFRMSYDGDACLTLRTKVQANPLNTYLSTTPSFTSPNPLAASSPLTIPVQITLSHFRLSGFVILVFSKAKGITLVFRNDPLESLKVSSTFDSIPFIAEYLQKEIERQVRRLFQEDLPVAVHRLSLRLWNPEYAASLEEEATAPAKPLRYEGTSDEADQDPDDQFVNPLLAPSDSSDSPSTTFSQKNLLKLASLVDAQRTLSLETPTISDVVFRAWASGCYNNTTWDRADSSANASHTDGSSENGDSVETQSMHSVRPNLTTMHSSRHISTTGAPGRRKKKHHVVDLRKKKEKGDATPTSTATTTPDSSECAIDDGFCERPAAAIRRGRHREDSIDYDSDSRPNLRPITPQQQTVPVTLQRPPSPADSIAIADIAFPPTTPVAAAPPLPKPVPVPKPSAQKEKEALRAREAHPPSPRFRLPPGTQGTILEQAILSKIMMEIQRSLEEERIKRGGQQATSKWGVERELENLCSSPGEELPAYAD